MGVKRFTTRKVEIEAIQWTGTNRFNVLGFIGDKVVSMKYDEDFFTIHTLEGDMKASKGDFIIKGLGGEFYPCKPSIFVKKYEEK